MKYFGQDELYIKASCEKCDKVLKINRNYIKEEMSSGYNLNTQIQCPCGNLSCIIKNKTLTTDSFVCCPKCKSTQLNANKKGFGIGKAIVGGVLTGGVGILGGFIGSGKVIITCLKCGYQWKAGK